VSFDREAWIQTYLQREDVKERRKLAARRYRRDHREEYLASVRARRQKPDVKAKLRAASYNWRQRNADTLRYNQRAYNKSPAGILASTASRFNRRAKNLGCPGVLRKRDLELFYMNFHKLFSDLVCTYCFRMIDIEHHLDHKIPLCRGGSNTLDNLTVACVDCNTHKQGQDPHTYQVWVVAELQQGSWT